MIEEAQHHLQKAGLGINEAKTAYLTTHPAAQHQREPHGHENLWGAPSPCMTIPPQDMNIKA